MTEGDSRSGGPTADRSSSFRFHQECYACPVGTLYASLRDVSPEALSHLVAAAAEMAAAARVVLEAFEAAASTQRSGVRRGGIERITIA